MGFFKDTRPYTAISADLDALTSPKSEEDPAKLLLVIELIQGNRVGGCNEAGRALRKKLKYGESGEQLRTLNLVSILVDNGGNSLHPMVTETGLGDQIVALARTSGESRQAKKAQQVLLKWSNNGGRLGNYFTSAGLKEVRPRKTRESRSRSFYEDDAGIPPTLPSRPSRTARPTPVSNDRSRSPSPINLRGASLTTTVATAHSVATRLLNSIILAETNPSRSRESRGYYRQAKQIRHILIQLISDEDPEVQAYVAQLLQGNEELLNSIHSYERVLSGEELDAERAEPLPEIRPLRPPPSPAPPIIPVRSPPSISDDASISVSDESSVVEPPSAKSAGDEDMDPFRDDNEETYAPKHTPIW